MMTLDLFAQRYDNRLMNIISLDDKSAQLKTIIRALERVLVAFSGGTDSSYLLSVCLDLLGPERVLAATIDSPLTPRSELAAAKELAQELGARHQIVPWDDLAIPMIASNPPDRCYHCKHSRFTALREIAQEKGFTHLVHGENLEDAADYRPGAQAASELAVRAPLLEAGLTKAEIRSLSRQRGLSNWNLPARACLASRFPYGTQLTAENLARVEAAEDLIHQSLGLRQFRVRDHHPVARLEVEPEHITLLASPEVREQIVTRLQELGYHYVTLDLKGYRMGSLNDVLDQ